MRKTEWVRHLEPLVVVEEEEEGVTVDAVGASAAAAVGAAESLTGKDEVEQSCTQPRDSPAGDYCAGRRGCSFDGTTGTPASPVRVVTQ